MLGLLSKYVVGEIASSSSESTYTDTDEEVLAAPAMPVINIDQTELGQDALEAEDPRIDSPACTSPAPSENDTPLEIPDKETCDGIKELVEYYLSEGNLVKDMFMLKHVTKHREGCVSLKLLSTYKKVKHLTKDWRVVAHAIKDSETLELNAEGTKVRRRHPLPPELDQDTKAFRTLIAVNIPRDLSNMSALAEVFGKYGDMVSLQMHKPGGRVACEVRAAERDHPGIGVSVCAVVEYEKVHQARQAFRSLSGTPECGFRVLEVSRRKANDQGNQSQRASLLSLQPIRGHESESAYYSNSDFSEPPSPVTRVRTFPRLRSPCSPSPKLRRANQQQRGPQQHQQQQQSSPESSPPSPYSPRRRVPTPSSSPEERIELYPRYASPCTSPIPRRPIPHSPESPFLPRRCASSRGATHTDGTVSAPLSPWLRRRGVSASNTPAASPLASPSLRRRHDSSVILPDNVTRFPKGPDGTKGFPPRRTLLLGKA